MVYPSEKDYSLKGAVTQNQIPSAKQMGFDGVLKLTKYILSNLLLYI
jgi:hypothetical protein